MSEISDTAKGVNAAGNAGIIHNPVEQNNVGRGARNNPNNRHFKRGRDTQFSIVSRSYEGSTPEIGCVLGLNNETVTKKVTFDIFCGLFETYIM